MRWILANADFIGEFVEEEAREFVALLDRVISDKGE